MTGGNFVPCLPGEVPALVNPRHEMAVYDTLHPDLRAAIASAEGKVRPSTVARFLGRMSVEQIVSTIREKDVASRPVYEAHCVAEAKAVAQSWRRSKR